MFMNTLNIEYIERIYTYNRYNTLYGFWSTHIQILLQQYSYIRSWAYLSLAVDHHERTFSFIGLLSSTVSSSEEYYRIYANFDNIFKLVDPYQKLYI